MTVASPPPASSMYPSGLSPDMPGHRLTYTGVAPGGKRLPAPSFHALVEILNPLEHLPVVSTIYQAITGDTPSIGEQMAGDVLYGGPIGLVSSVAHTMIEGVVKIFEGKGAAAASPTAVALADATPGGQAQDAIVAGGRARALGLAPGAVLAETSETAIVAAAPGGQTPDAIVAGGRARALGLAPGAVLAQAAATAPAAAGPANAPAALDPAPEANTITTAEATPAAAASDLAPLVPTADDAADPGAISGPLIDAGNFSAPATDKPAPVPLAPPDRASAAAPTAKVAATADRHAVFMPLHRRGPRFFAVNNAPNHRTFYGMNTARPASATATASRATSPATSPAAAQVASRAAAAPVTPSAIAAALAPALDQPMPPALSPASSLANPLSPSLSPAALAATEAASAKYSRALDLAQKLKFFYGGQAPTRGLVP